MAERNMADGVASQDLVEGAIIAGKLGDVDLVLVRSNGKVCALAGQCTHAGAPLAEGLVAEGTLRCPWHHARFQIETGEALGAPAFAPLDRFSVTEEDGLIRIGDLMPVPSPDVAAGAADLGRVIIVGGGAAGHACAEMLARHGAGASVTILAQDPDGFYDRTACSKQYLAGEAERDELALPAPAGATIRQGVTVTGIDASARTVRLNDGATIAYDRLVLATGASPVAPDFEGADRDDVFVLRAVADADAIVAAADKADSAIVIGSSYIGLEVAASLVSRGLLVTVVSNADVPLEKTAGREIGSMVCRLHQDHGVVFHNGRSVRSWDGATAILDDGTQIAGRLVVAGIGVKPRIDLAEQAGLRCADKSAGGGVVVDEFLRTSDPAIHALGDIAHAPDSRLDHSIRVEHWVVAQRMGQWLARHMLGLIDTPYRDVPFFWSGHYDVNLRYVGHAQSSRNAEIDGDVDRHNFCASFGDQGEEHAMLTCGRDRAALEFERDLERGADRSAALG